MKTIKEAAHEYFRRAQLHLAPAGSEYGFVAGVEFAQQFHPIERDKDWFTTSKQDEEFQKNFPILVKGNYGIELVNELTSDLNRQSYGYTHWRPVNLK